MKDPESISNVKKEAYEFGVDVSAKYFQNPKNPKKFRLKEFHRIATGSYLCGKVSMIEDIIQLWEMKGKPKDVDELMGDIVVLLKTNYTAFQESNGSYFTLKQSIDDISKKIGLYE